MLIETDTLSFELLENGTPVDIAQRNSSRYHLENLEEKGLIQIRRNKIFLTEKGQVAKKFGIRKFLKIEEFEKEVMEYDSENNLLYSRNFLFTIYLLFILLGLLLLYITFLIR